MFDNSISITTVNGEVFLTSFVYRNAAYDSIVKSLDISINQDAMFEEEEEEQLEEKQEGEE